MCERKLWNGKVIRRLLLTVTIINLEWFTLKDKLVIYTDAFIELYNAKNLRQVHEIYRMIELKKMYTLTVENLRNLDSH